MQTINDTVRQSADHLQAAADSLQRAAIALNPTASAVPGPESSGWWLFLEIACFVVVGLVMSLAAMWYTAKNKLQPVALAQAVVSGGIASSVVSTLGTKVGGLPVPLTVAQAVLISGLSFCLGLLGWLGVGLLVIRYIVVIPIRKRFGPVYGTRAWSEAWSGVESLHEWIVKTVQMRQADEAWDEFACACVEVHRKLEGVVAGVQVQQLSLAILSRASGSSKTSEEPQVEALRKTIAESVECLASRLTLTTLNFTVWRVAKGAERIEHLISIPVEPHHNAGYGHKPDLEIWSGRGKASSGSLAAEAMLEGRYTVMKAGEKYKHWEPRGLGRSYDSVGAMPVPCDCDDGGVPWAVVCVENREGVLPIDRNCMRQLLAQIARAIHQTAPLLRVADIDQARHVSRGNPQSGIPNDHSATVVSSPLRPQTVPGGSDAFMKRGPGDRISNSSVPPDGGSVEVSESNHGTEGAS